MRFYRLMGKIASIVIWPFAWPVLLFQRLAGEEWWSSKHDTGSNGAIALQCIWILGLILFASFILSSGGL
jgi:hypothetical protein